jgi:hypothetical protein
MARQKVCRVGDMGSGSCSAHGPVTVTMVQGHSDQTDHGLDVCSVTSRGVASCGHGATATTGSGVRFVHGLPIFRVGDSGTIDGGGSFTMVTGSPTTDSE